MGRTQYRTLGKVFQALRHGKRLGESPFKRAFKVNQAFIVSGVTFIQNRLPPQPARSREVLLDGEPLGILPVLDRGNATAKDLFNEYRAGHPQDQHLGMPMFRQLLKALSCPCKSLGGLSSYYVDMLHLADTVHQMLEHAGDEGGDLDQAADLRKHLRGHVEWLKYTYSHRHLTAGTCDGVARHCPKSALAGSCDVPHVLGCAECEDQAAVLPAVSSFLLASLGNDAKRAVKLLECQFERFRAHKLRERWQRGRLDVLLRGLAEDPSHLHVVIDHKQKVLPARNRESQQEYFGKTGKDEGGRGRRRD
jgi:hypothetical protein